MPVQDLYVWVREVHDAWVTKVTDMKKKTIIDAIMYHFRLSHNSIANFLFLFSKKVVLRHAKIVLDFGLNKYVLHV